jgi:hypothetical protein
MLETKDGQTITIELLRADETQVDEYTVQIQGSSYDIFATPSK